MVRLIVVGAALGAASSAWPQTQLDLRNQARNVDFSNASTTRPVKVGTVLPAACASGSLFFKSDAPQGSNLYGCTATNTWSVLTSGSGGSGGSGVSNASELASALACNPASNSGAAYSCTVAGVSSYGIPLTLILTPDVQSAGVATLNVNGLGARAILRPSANGLIGGELTVGSPYLLSFDGVAFRITGEQLESDGTGTITINRSTIPRTIGISPNVFGQLGGSNAWLGNNDFSSGHVVLPQLTVAALPSAGSNAGKVFVVTDGTSASDCTIGGGGAAALCRSTGTGYSALGGSGGSGGGTSPETILYKATNITLACTGVAQFITTYTIPAGTMAVGDVVTVEAAMDRPVGTTDSGMYIQFGGVNFPQFGFLGGGSWIRSNWTVVSPTAEVGSGIAMKGIGGAFGGDSYSGTSNANIANPVLVGVGIDSSCTAGNSYRVQYLIVRRIR